MSLLGKRCLEEGRGTMEFGGYNRISLWSSFEIACSLEVAFWSWSDTNIGFWFLVFSWTILCGCHIISPTLLASGGGPKMSYFGGKVFKVNFHCDVLTSGLGSPYCLWFSIELIANLPIGERFPCHTHCIHEN